MNFIQKLKLIERIDSLISRKSTGTPLTLSQRIGVSERTLYNILGIMKKLGAPIFYCSGRNSYCYSEEVSFSYTFNVIEEQNQDEMAVDVFNIQSEDQSGTSIVKTAVEPDKTNKSGAVTNDASYPDLTRPTRAIGQRSELIESIMRYRETKIS